MCIKIVKKERDKRYCGGVELVDNESEFEMFEKLGIELDTDIKADLKNIANIRVGSTETHNFISIKSLDFNRGKDNSYIDMIKAMYMNNIFFPQNRDWHKDNIASVSNSCEGIAILSKNSSEGLLISRHNYGESIALAFMNISQLLSDVCGSTKYYKKDIEFNISTSLLFKPVFKILNDSGEVTDETSIFYVYKINSTYKPHVAKIGVVK